MNDTWTVRCRMCGDYARGHGQVPVFGERWVCGFCAVEEHVLVDQRVPVRSCHYVVVDLDMDRG